MESREEGEYIVESLCVFLSIYKQEKIKKLLFYHSAVKAANRSRTTNLHLLCADPKKNKTTQTLTYSLNLQRGVMSHKILKQTKTSFIRCPIIKDNYADKPYLFNILFVTSFVLLAGSHGFLTDSRVLKLLYNPEPL